MTLVLVVLAAFALYVMNGDERARLLRWILTAFGRVKALLDPSTLKRSHSLEGDQPRRFSFTVVAPLLAVGNILLFARMLLDAGAVSDAETLLRWGGSFGPRTTNGEWWRLLTALFVHRGAVQLVADLVGLVFVGIVLEDLLGPLAIVAVYVCSGAVAGLVSLSTHPAAVNVGASGAIFGLYGVLLAALVWGLFDRAPVRIPVVALRRVGIATALFMLYNLAGSSIDRPANLAGLVTGLVAGIVLARSAGTTRPAVRRVATVVASTAVLAIACALPLRGMTDVKPELERVVTLEDRTATAYQAAVDRFKEGRITAVALARVIDGTIMPQLRAAATRLDSLEHVPQDQQWVIGDAKEYLRLRIESWRLRATALYKGNMRVLREADQAERASLAVFEKVRNADLM
jgi:membrane associated rhomboid family serine protease